MSSQSLSEFQWKNRLVVIFSETEDTEEIEKQTQLFNKELKGFKDRKLKLILVLPTKQKVIIPETSNWKDSNLFHELKGQDKTVFEVILIGLDGGVKLRQENILEPKKLFNLIDSMPMRQAEIRRKND